MPNITDPRAVKFANEQIRPAANLLPQAYYYGSQTNDRWVGLGSGQTALDQMQTDIRKAADKINAAYKAAYCLEKNWFGVSGLSALFPNDSSPVFDNNGTGQRTDVPAITGAMVNNVVTRCIEIQNWLLSQAGSFTAIPQVETATAVGTITGTGNATVVVTANQMTGSPRTVSVAVTSGDTATVWAGKVRTALAADSTVNAFFSVGGATTAIVLTALNALANDPSMNVSLANGTSTGITAAPTSANTTAGVPTRNGLAYWGTVLQVATGYGPATIVLGDAGSLINRLNELKTNYTANASANLTTLLAVANNPQGV